MMKLRTSLKYPSLSLIALTLALLVGQTVYGQAPLETATRRSKNAAKTIEVITALPEDETIPKELFERAQAIGVFPDTVRMNLLFSQGIKGYGVFSSRLPEGWSLPSYYRFGSSTFSAKIAGGKSFDLVILFMNKETINWFQEGRIVFKDLRAGVPGPIGKWTKAMDLETSGVSVFIYMLVDGKLKGMSADSDILNASLIDPDNNINKVIYGIKGREILKGTPPKSATPTTAVTAFSDTLKEKFPVSKSASK